MARTGYPTKFAVSGIFIPVDLSNDSYSVDFMKDLYDAGIKNIQLTAEGEKKYLPKSLRSSKT